jgi:hypothetical protein
MNGGEIVILNRVEAPGMNVVEAPGMNVVEAPGTNGVEAPGMSRVEAFSTNARKQAQNGLCSVPVHPERVEG